MSSIAIRKIQQKVVSTVTQPLYIGGITDDGSDAAISILSDGSISEINATVVKQNGNVVATQAYVVSAIDAIPDVIDATSLVKGIDYKGLLYEAVVTGSDVTSIDFPLLDINTHKSYRVEIEMVNMSACALYCFVNADTTVTNYYTQTSGGAAAAWSGARYNNPSVIQANITGSQIGSFLIERVNGVPNLVGIGSSQLGTTPAFYNFFTLKTATVTNITQLTFTSSVASAIGVGSKIRIYRGDV